ncbi:MAG: MFS transporter [Acidobacteria bacterium]|nr:MFS transporter [Acidobacteriota bacterium]
MTPQRPSTLPKSHGSAVMPGAVFAVSVLTAMNLLNYLDRYVPSAVKDLFKSDLKLTDAETSLPLSAFVVVYMLASPVFGALADRHSRKGLIALGVALWSLATAAAAFATGFWSFLAARACVGVGEAAYATLAPALMSDLYPPERRNRVLTVFYTAIPIGAALGFSLGGILGEHLGWRAAFLIVGLPGVAAAVTALMIRDPGLGAQDGKPSGPPPSWKNALHSLRRNREYVLAVAGYTAITFASGGMADWFPTFLSRHRGMSHAEAGSVLGTVTIIGGLLGTLTGGILADRLRGRTRHPYLALSAVSMAPAFGFAVLALTLQDRAAIIGCILLAQFFLWFYNGPINTVLLNCVEPAYRARAFSLSILLIHILGDAVSPPIIGAISDLTGSLPLAMWLIPATMGLGTVIWAWAWRKLPA